MVIQLLLSIYNFIYLYRKNSIVIDKSNFDEMPKPDDTTESPVVYVIFLNKTELNAMIVYDVLYYLFSNLKTMVI